MQVALGIYLFLWDEGWDTVEGLQSEMREHPAWGRRDPTCDRTQWGCCWYRCPHFLCPPQELSKRFTAIRKTKGDGNCFYRALGYSYLESLLGKSREILK